MTRLPVEAQQTSIRCSKDEFVGSVIADSAIRVYFDGNGQHTRKMLREGRQSVGRAEWRVYWPDGKVDIGCEKYRNHSNNQLEYLGLIHSLTALISYQQSKGEGSFCVADTNVVVMGDSQLIVNQANGMYKVKTPHLVPLNERVKDLLAQCRKLYQSVIITWVPSNRNLADQHE